MAINRIERLIGQFGQRRELTNGHFGSTSVTRQTEHDVFQKGEIMSKTKTAKTATEVVETATTDLVTELALVVAQENGLDKSIKFGDKVGHKIMPLGIRQGIVATDAKGRIGVRFFVGNTSTFQWTKLQDWSASHITDAPIAPIAVPSQSTAKPTPKATIEPLTKGEATTLTKLEAEWVKLQQIEKTLPVKQGKVLFSIKEGKLYRIEFKSFEAYCDAKFGITRQHGNRLVRAYEFSINVVDVSELSSRSSEAMQTASATVAETLGVTQAQSAPILADILAKAQATADAKKTPLTPTIINEIAESAVEAIANVDLTAKASDIIANAQAKVASAPTTSAKASTAPTAVRASILTVRCSKHGSTKIESFVKGVVGTTCGCTFKQ